jgi:hypothetical protein
LFPTGIIFPFTHMCTQYLHYINLHMPFPHFLPLPLVPATNPPDRTCSALLFSDFEKDSDILFV